MKYGRLNIIIGSIVLILGGIGGFILGATLDAALQDGGYAMPFTRIFTRGGHTHGLLFAFYNLIVGMLVDRFSFSDRMKRATSIIAALALVMSVGLLMRGLSGGSMAFAPVALIGGALFITSAVFLLIGSVKGFK